MKPDLPRHPARYHVFSRAEWAALRASTAMSLGQDDLDAVRGLNDPSSIADVVDIHLPLSRLLNLRVAAARRLSMAVESEFLGRTARPAPFVIGIAGSVAVGKSTFSRLLQTVLARWRDHPRVDLVTTDGFLLPREALEARGLMRRKGFPESYDLRAMLRFLGAVKANGRHVRSPVYSHEAYDIIPDRFQVTDRPDILIFEGLNVLQTVSQASAVASDFFDFSIYVDADPAVTEDWYVARFKLLQRTVFSRPSSYFHHYKDLTETEAEKVARGIWRDINLPNLMENIRPTRERADLVIRKGASHAVEELWLRRS